ncbi:MAG: glycosyltransferase family 39 protein [Armatimonadota bacterium]|nr:glycosyltransferase family 39 protein [Armatimonadota bacterium]
MFTRLHSWFSKVELALVIVIQAVAVLFFALAIPSIQYSFIGDEYAFYNFAREIAEGRRSESFFSLNGVYGQDPVLGSCYQAAIMRLLGTHIYAWKFSSIVIIFPLGILTFYTIKTLLNAEVAFLALLITDTSFYYHHFFQIGYLNNLSLFWLSVLLYLLVRIDFTDAKTLPRHLVLLGIVCGLSWYFYIGKLFFVVIALFLGVMLWRQPRRWRNLGLYLLPVIALIALSILSTSHGSGNYGLAKSVLHREYSDTGQLFKNMGHGFILSVYTSSPSHYLPTNSYLDKFTGLAALIGEALLIFQLVSRRGDEGHRKVILFFVVLCFAIGLTSPYPYPPTSRGIHYVPFYIVFACYMFSLLARRLKRHWPIAFYAALCCLIVSINARYIAQPLPLNTTQQILADLRQMENQRILLVETPSHFNLSNVRTLAEGYRLPNAVDLSTETPAPDVHAEYDYVFANSPLPYPASKIKEYNDGVILYSPRM